MGRVSNVGFWRSSCLICVFRIHILGFARMGADKLVTGTLYRYLGNKIKKLHLIRI